MLHDETLLFVGMSLKSVLLHDTTLLFVGISIFDHGSDKKYRELNGAALNVNKPCLITLKTAFQKDK